MQSKQWFPTLVDLSTDAKTLYGILLDRMGLSVKNGWLDEQGRVYIIFPVQEVMDVHWAAQTTRQPNCSGNWKSLD